MTPLDSALYAHGRASALADLCRWFDGEAAHEDLRRELDEIMEQFDAVLERHDSTAEQMDEARRVSSAARDAAYEIHRTRVSASKWEILAYAEVERGREHAEFIALAAEVGLAPCAEPTRNVDPIAAVAK